MDCDIIITINGKVVKTAHSDAELDNWILENKSQLSDGIEHGFVKVFSINSVNETLTKLNTVESKHSDFLKNKGKDGFTACAVTTFWNLFGGVNGTPLIDFKDNGEKRNHAVDPIDVGTQVDEILNRGFKGQAQKQNYSYITPGIQKYLVESISKNIMPAIRSLGIKITHPETQIKIQFGMSTNSFQEDIKKAIEDSVKTFESGNKNNPITRAANLIRYISGVADILIIDDDGIVHVGDFKTWNPSPNEQSVGNQFILGSHKNYIAQVTTYKEILRQAGIPIGQGFLIVYETDYDDNSEGEHQRLKSVTYKDIIKIPNSGTIQDAVQSALWKETTVTDDSIKKTMSVLKELFPSTTISAELKARELDFNFMRKAIHKVNENDPEYKKGNRYYFVKKRSVIGGFKNVPVYGKTERELIEDTVDPNTGKVVKSPFREYFDLLNKKKAVRFTNIAKDLMYAMVSHDLQTWEETIDSIAPGNKDTLLHHFKRYILCNWKFKENAALNSNGIYIFEKGDYLEIVVLDEENLINQRVKLLHGDSILGTFAKNSSLTDNRQIMTSDYGNLMLMKACALLSVDPEITKNKKILNIKALNLHNARVYEENNNRLIDNWNSLARAYNRTHTDKLRTLGNYSFEYTPKALNIIADEFIECLWHINTGNSKINYLYQNLESQKEVTVEYILEKLNQLEKIDYSLKDSHKKDHSDPLWNAYAYLRKALLALQGINMFQEKDLGAVLQGINATGIRMRSFNSSNSPLARQMGETMANFRSAIRLEFVKQQFTWSKLIDAAYKERGFSGTIGNDWSFFKSWFELDESGNIKPEFRLVRPDKFKGGPTEKKAYEYFIEMNAKYRWPDEDDRDAYRGSDEWYEVPMLHAGFIEEFTSGKPLGALKYTWEKLKDASLAMILGNPDVEKTRKQLNQVDVDKLPNVIYKDESRRHEYVTKYGVDGLEKNLDFVFLSMLYSGIRSEKSPLFCELFTSFLVVADYMMDTSGLDIQEIRLAMEDYIKSKLFGSDIRDNKNLNALVGVLKGITAKVALGWNTRAFFREVLTGQKKHFNRWLSKADNQFIKGTRQYFIRPEFIDYSEFVSAYTDVVSKIFDNASIFGFYHQLNAIYGMVNFSNEEMAEASKRHQWTVLGVSEKSSVTATAPDFLHRMAILVGHLKTIGAFDAYSLDDDTGRLVYDMHKDSRFQTWLKYKDNEDSIPDIETRRNFNYEKKKYEEELEAWRHADFSLNYGDLLPQALSPRAALLVKEYADEQYGNYDEETKSLVQKQTLGSLFLQYKTYGLAQFALWFSEPTYTNTLAWIDVVDDKGRKMVQIPTTPEEYSKHGDFKEKPEDEVTEEEWKRPGTRYIRQLSGDLFIGKAQSDYLLISKLFTLNGDEFLQLWNENPEFRSNLYISMLDLLEMALIGLLLRIFWNTEETPIARQGFIPRWTYGVLQGMSTDGPLFQTLSGIVGDGAPPVFGMVKGYYSTFMSIINGNTNLMYGLTNTVGMTRELSNLFRSYR